jgi:ATP-dependent Clp protease ATP-binding subunit ClpC
VDAKNAIFIMTSNIGTEVYHKKESIGFKGFAGKEEQAAKKEIIAQVKKVFRPEFLNRLDEIIIFRPLGDKELSTIAYNLIDSLRKRLGAKGILFNVEEEVLEFVCREGYDPFNGARPLARTIERLITKPLSERIIAGEFTPGDKILVTVRDNRIVFTKVERDE